MKNQLKISLLFLITVLAAITSNAQRYRTVKGNGKMTEITRNVGNFDAMSVSGSFEVKLISGKEGVINIKAEENLIGLIETKVEGGTLRIKWRKNTSISTKRNIYITVAVDRIKEIRVTGASDVTSEKILKEDELKLSVSGSGGMNLEVDTDYLYTSITGSGDIDLKGKTDRLKASVSGSGDLDAKQLNTRKVEARVSGSGEMTISVQDELIARVSGSGDIRYKGNPRKEDINVSGSGEVSTF